MEDKVISISGLSKRYKSGLLALDDINLEINKGEIFALLGPNGAGKTTLISTICGIVNPGQGQVLVDGFDIITQYRNARKQIGLVPQELALSVFESVWATVKFSRGLYGRPQNDAYLEKLLRELSLWEKKDSRIRELSGGMKRRVLIAKALAHEPEILFLDEPTAGVDVELRQEMWGMIRRLRDNGVTIILTTHYIDEAEDMADRIAVISAGKIILVDQKASLMAKLGKKQLALQLHEAIDSLPDSLAPFRLKLQENGSQIIYEFNSQDEHNEIPGLLKSLAELNIEFRDLHTSQSSLEDIFVSLVGANK